MPFFWTVFNDIFKSQILSSSRQIPLNIQFTSLFTNIDQKTYICFYSHISIKWRSFLKEILFIWEVSEWIIRCQKIIFQLWDYLSMQTSYNDNKGCFSLYRKLAKTKLYDTLISNWIHVRKTPQKIFPSQNIRLDLNWHGYRRYLVFFQKKPCFTGFLGTII